MNARRALRLAIGIGCLAALVLAVSGGSSTTAGQATNEAPFGLTAEELPDDVATARQALQALPAEVDGAQRRMHRDFVEYVTPEGRVLELGILHPSRAHPDEGATGRVALERQLRLRIVEESDLEGAEGLIWGLGRRDAGQADPWEVLFLATEPEGSVMLGAKGDSKERVAVLVGLYRDALGS